MAKSKRRKSIDPEIPLESQSAEALTIGWMLSVMTALICEFGVVAAWLYSSRNPDDKRVGMTGELLLFAAAVVGTAVLVLTPLAHKARVVAPPLAVTLFAIVVGAAPWLVIVWQLLGKQ